MPTTSINITEQLHDWIAMKVDSGDYNNASEVFREGLRLLKARDEREILELELLCQKVQMGVEQANKKQFSQRNMQQIIKSAKDTLGG